MTETFPSPFSGGHESFRDLAATFSRRELLEKRGERDRFPFVEFDGGPARAMGELGFYGIMLPAEHGGTGDEGALEAILEEISKVDAGMAAIVFANAAAAGIINAASADGDCAEAYRLVTASGTPLAFQAYAHPSESALPRAEPHGEGAVLSGVAGYIVNGGIADLALIPAEGPGGVSYYLVDLWQTAVSLSMPLFSLGMRACPAVDATLAGAAGTPVGLPGRGVSYFERMRERLSAASAAILVGIMKGSFEDALAYARERFQGGRKIIDWPEVGMLLARMSLDIEAAAGAAARAVRLRESGTMGWERASLATAVIAGETAVDAASHGLQVFGGNGYMRDYPQEKRFRDARQAVSLLGMVNPRRMACMESIIEGK